MKAPSPVVVRETREEDFAGIIALCELTYAGSPPWTTDQLSSHRRVFPEGQIVAIDGDGDVVGYAASLIIRWDDYPVDTPWRDITDSGFFTNHDPARGRTLYGAEVMVSPKVRKRGIGGRLYSARRQITRRLGLLRIRAGARLRGYHKHAAKITAVEYVQRVIAREFRDPTLSFQLSQGFDVLAVVEGYLRHDPESLGWAAIIEWLNPRVATEADRAGRDGRFLRAEG